MEVYQYTSDREKDRRGVHKQIEKLVPFVDVLGTVIGILVPFSSCDR